MINQQILTILENATCEDQKLYLNCPQLDRKTYEAVNKVLDAMGGKWKGGKVRAHIFEADPRSILEEVLSTGEMPEKNPFAFFATPPEGVEMILDQLPPLNAGDRVLEPSAGNGAIADGIERQFPFLEIEVAEIDDSRSEMLVHKGYNLVARNFLEYSAPRTYRAIAMNPPFRVKGDMNAYVTHICHALHMLQDGGRLVSVAPSGLTFSNITKVKTLRNLIEARGGWTSLPDGLFKSSGTNAATVLLWIDA